MLFLILVAAALGLVQLGSDAIFARAGEPQSLPAHLQPALGVAIYRTIDRAAPAPYADAMLARAALDAGNVSQARAYAKRLPPSAVRDDLLAQAAAMRGDTRTAEAYFVRAGDIEAISRTVAAMTDSNPAGAYALEAALLGRLRRSGTHPDAVAEAHWELGELAWRQQKQQLAMQNYNRAIALSPLSEKYLLSAGFAAYQMKNVAGAQRDFARVLSQNPASAEAYAGMGMVALSQGDRSRAATYAQRARSLDPNSHALATLEALLHSP